MSDFELEIYEGVGQVRRVPIEDGARLKVGRTQACDVVLGGAGISRLHCLVTRTGAAVRIVNKSSTKGGTKVNGERVDDSRALTGGEEIAVGEMVLVFHALAPARPAAPPPVSDEPLDSDDRSRGSHRDADDEPLDDLEDDESLDEPEPDSARLATEEFLRRKQVERNVRLVMALVFLAALSGTLAWVGVRVMRPGSGEEVPVAGPAVPGAPTRRPLPSIRDLAPPGAGADKVWRTVQRLSPLALPEGLEAFADQFPDDPRAEDALFFAQHIRGAKGASGSRRVEAVGKAMLTEAKRLREGKDPARAQAVLDLAATLLPGTRLARQARTEQRELRKEAAEAFEELGGRTRALAARLGPVQAIIHVLDARPRLRGLGIDDDLDALVAELEQRVARELQAAVPGPEVELSNQALTVQKEGLDAAHRFAFPRAWERLDELLTLGLEERARLEAHWLRHQVRAYEELFAKMLEAAKGPAEGRPTLTVGGPLKARLVSADHEHVVLAPILEQGEGDLRWRWSRVTAFQVQELLANQGQGDWRFVQAKALHAFKTGLDERGIELLLPYAHRKRLRGEVHSFYSLATGTPLPEGGFVIFEGRFVSPDEKDRIIAARKAARAAAKDLAAKAREEKSRKKLLLILQRALALMDDGHYSAGRSALARIAKRHADVKGVGDAARARLESIVLRRRDIRLAKRLGRNGPPANRLDIYILGDGYVLHDQKQVQFDRHANVAAKFCQQQDFFKEYDSYINYWATNLISNDEGLTKDGKKKDTALGTEVQNGRHMVTNPGRVFRLLEQSFPGEHDRLAVCLGNEHATVATGGGGTVAVCKTMLEATPHEIGHAYGSLADEDDEEPGPNPPPPQPYSGDARVVGANVVAGNDREEMLAIVPWKDWLDPSGGGNWTKKPIDLFEGANRQRRGYWRPQRVCLMRDVGSPCCAVCMNVMIRRLYTHVRPIDQVWPEETEIAAGDDPFKLRVVVMKPATHALFVHWRRKWLGVKRPTTGSDEEPDDPDKTRERDQPQVDDKKKLEPKSLSGKLELVQGRYVHYITVRPRKLEPGRYEVSAEVWDPTPWVKEKHRKELMTQTHRWVVTVPPR